MGFCRFFIGGNGARLGYYPLFVQTYIMVGLAADLGNRL